MIRKYIAGIVKECLLETVPHAQRANDATRVDLWFSPYENAFTHARNTDSFTYYEWKQVSLPAVLNSLVESGVLKFDYRDPHTVPAKLTATVTCKGKK